MKILFFAISFLSIAVFAQQKEIESDRPDLSESASSVEPGYFQIETGFEIRNSTDEINNIDLNSRELSLLSTLIRYGIYDGIELRLEAGYLVQKISPLQSGDLEGINDLSFGTKIELVQDNSGLPDAAILIHFDLPLGNENFKPEKVEPELILALEHALSERFDMAYNFGGNWDSENEKIIFFYAAAVETPLTDKLGAFAEFFGEAASGISFTKNIDAGLTYLIENNFQADISAGINFNQPENNWFWGLGISFRLPD